MIVHAEDLREADPGGLDHMTLIQTRTKDELGKKVFGDFLL